MARYLSESRREQGWHVWPQVSVRQPGRRRTTAKEGWPAYCGFTSDHPDHDVWDFELEAEANDGGMAVKWYEYLHGDGPFPKGDESRVCAECARVFREGLYCDADWQRDFRAEHGLGGDA